jgi:hypothetical protein
MKIKITINKPFPQYLMDISYKVNDEGNIDIILPGIEKMEVMKE